MDRFAIEGFIPPHRTKKALRCPARISIPPTQCFPSELLNALRNTPTIISCALRHSGTGLLIDGPLPQLAQRPERRLALRLFLALAPAAAQLDAAMEHGALELPVVIRAG